MPKCSKCSQQYPYRLEIDGKLRSLSSRRLCLECKPFTPRKESKERLCRVCGVKYTGGHRSYAERCPKCVMFVKRREIKQRAIDLLGGKCSKCGYSKCHGAMHFHHINRKEKEIQISITTSWSRIEKELEKCILLCANCHAELHYQF